MPTGPLPDLHRPVFVGGAVLNAHTLRFQDLARGVRRGQGGAGGSAGEDNGVQREGKQGEGDDGPGGAVHIVVHSPPRREPRTSGDSTGGGRGGKQGGGGSGASGKGRGAGSGTDRGRQPMPQPVSTVALLGSPGLAAGVFRWHSQAGRR